MNRLLFAGFVAAFMLCGSAVLEQTVPTASAAEQVQQAAPAQAAAVKTKKGEVIKVYSFIEGGIICVMPDGSILSGEDAVSALAAEGISVSAGADGAMQIGPDSAVISAPHAATPAEASAARAAASPVSAAPAGIASDGGRMNVESFSTTMGSSYAPGSIGGKSVSK